MNGKGTVTFKMGIPIQATSSTALLAVMVSLSPRMVGPMKGSLLMASRRAKAPLTTEANVVYKGTFKQGIYQNAH